MYTFDYIEEIDLSSEGGPHTYRVQDVDSGQDYYVPVNLVADGYEAVDYVKHYGIVRMNRPTISGTYTKFLVDDYGLVISGMLATTADIASSADKRYVTDAQLVVIGNTSGVNTGDQDLSGYALTANVVPNTRTVNGNALSSNVTITLASLGGAASGANTDLTSVLLNQSGLVVKGGDANALTIKPNETLTAGRVLNFIVNDASRTIDLGGNLTVSSAATVAGTNTGDQDLSSYALTANVVPNTRTVNGNALSSNVTITLASLGGAASGANTDITSVLLNQTGLVVKGGDSNALTIKPNETLTAGRILNVLVNDASRTVNLSGDLTVSSAATVAGTNTGDQDLSSYAVAANVVPNTRTVNGNALSSDVTITLASLGGAASGANGDITSITSVLTTLKATATGFKLQDTATKLLTIQNDNTLTGNRTLKIQIADADRTIALSGNLTVSSAATVAGTNTGDQTITLTGDVTGTGTGSFAATIANGAVTEAKMTLADNATNDVSITKHGFMVKAPNDNTKVWKGDGLYGKGWNVVVKTADQNVTNNNTLFTDNTLAFSMAANTNYIVRIRVFFTTGASGDFKYALTGPSSPTKVRIVRKHIDPTNLTTLITTSEAAITGSTTLAAGTGTTGGWVEFEISWQNGSNAATFGFQWAQATSNGTNTTVHAGSYLEWTTAA